MNIFMNHAIFFWTYNECHKCRINDFLNDTQDFEKIFKVHIKRYKYLNCSYNFKFIFTYFDFFYKKFNYMLPIREFLVQGINRST